MKNYSIIVLLITLFAVGGCGKSEKTLVVFEKGKEYKDVVDNSVDPKSITTKAIVSNEPEFVADYSGTEMYALAPRVYFYSKPDLSTKTNSYFVTDQTALLLGTAGDFTKVRFTYKGKTTEGFVLSSDVDWVYEPEGEDDF